VYIASANGKSWANPFAGVLPPFREQYLCIDAEKAVARLPITVALSLLLMGCSVGSLFVEVAAPLLGLLVLADAALRRLLVPSRLVGSATFQQMNPRFSRVLALDFLLNFLAIGCAILAFALGLPSGWALLAILLALVTMAIGAVPMICRALE
jgi:hypothetical protein